MDSPRNKEGQSLYPKTHGKEQKSLMKKHIHLFIEMEKIPTITAQQKGERVLNGKIIHYDKKQVKEAKELFLRLLKPYIPEEPYTKETPLSLEIVFYYPWNGRVKDEMARYKVTKPDADNAAKILIDCMTMAHFWHDDSQISSYHIEKIEVNKNFKAKFSKLRTGIEITIKPLYPAEDLEEANRKLEEEKKQDKYKLYDKFEAEYQSKKEYYDAFEETMQYFFKPLIHKNAGYQE